MSVFRYALAGAWVVCTLTLAAQPADSTFYSIAVAKLGGDLVLTPNAEGSFTLATLETENPSNNLPVTKYLVIRTHDKKIVEEGAVTMGRITWRSNYDLEISQSPGQVPLARDEGSNVKKLDLRRHVKNLAPR